MAKAHVRWPGTPGKYDSEARRWERDYATHLASLHHIRGKQARPAAVKKTSGVAAGINVGREQLAWDRSLSEHGGIGALTLAVGNFEGADVSRACRNSCGRELVRIGSAWVVQNESGMWRNAVKGLCPACYARAVRKGESALV